MTTSQHDKPKSWRDVLRIHPAAEMFPLMSADDLRTLGEDIKKHGLQSNIAVLCSGDAVSLLDGRNRLDATEAAGLAVEVDVHPRYGAGLFIGGCTKSAAKLFTPIGEPQLGCDEVDPYEFVLSANIHRRHLSPDDKRKLIADVLKAQPEKSNREIARQVKDDHHKVGAVRRELESTGEVSPVEKTVGKDGKARKPPAPVAKGEAFGPVALVVVDTSASIFPGDDENNNPQMIAHAKVQRSLCDLPGRPCVLALCHPPKNVSSQDQLLPRGGGGYLNETDGNFTLFTHGDKLCDLHWTGKFRGPDFEKITFHLTTITTTELTDAKGRLLPTVMAQVVTDQEAEENEAKAAFQESRLLAAMVAVPHGSFTDWAQHCGWMLPAKPGEPAKPYKSLVARVMPRLIENGIAKKAGRYYTLTKAGLAAAQPTKKSAA